MGYRLFAVHDIAIIGRSSSTQIKKLGRVLTISALQQAYKLKMPQNALVGFEIVKEIMKQVTSHYLYFRDKYNSSYTLIYILACLMRRAYWKIVCFKNSQV